MGRLRIITSLLVVIVFVLFVAVASIRMRDWMGIKLVVGLALGLNFACLIVLAADLENSIKWSALAYLVVGCGWLAMVALVPSIDRFFENSLITPGVVEWVTAEPNPFEPKKDPAFILLHLLSHALLSILLGSLGALAAWKLGSRFFDPDRSTSETTGPS